MASADFFKNAGTFSGSPAKRPAEDQRPANMIVVQGKAGYQATMRNLGPQSKRFVETSWMDEVVNGRKKRVPTDSSLTIVLQRSQAVIGHPPFSWGAPYFGKVGGEVVYGPYISNTREVDTLVTIINKSLPDCKIVEVEYEDGIDVPEWHDEGVDMVHIEELSRAMIIDTEFDLDGVTKKEPPAFEGACLPPFTPCARCTMSLHVHVRVPRWQCRRAGHLEWKRFRGHASENEAIPILCQGQPWQPRQLGEPHPQASAARPREDEGPLRILRPPCRGLHVHRVI